MQRLGDYTLVINNCPNVTVQPNRLPDGIIGAAYAETIRATPANTSYTLSLSQGALPPGLSFNSATGALSSTPTALGTFHFRITAISASGCTGSRDYELEVKCPAIRLRPNSLSRGTVGASYSETLTVTPAGS